MPNDGFNKQTEQLDDWCTPDWLFKALDMEFGLTFDAAANLKNAKCSIWSGDILYSIIPPFERVFCNPPYSNIVPFVERALASDNLWVMLLPSRTDTAWFQRLNESPRVTFRWFRKRIRFCLNGAEADSPRFGSVIAIVAPR